MNSKIPENYLHYLEVLRPVVILNLNQIQRFIHGIPIINKIIRNITPNIAPSFQKVPDGIYPKPYQIVLGPVA